MDALERRSLLKGLGYSSLVAAVTGDALAQASSSSSASDLMGQGIVLATAFGVKADGNIDDTAALQAAIDHALTRSGSSVVRLPPGKIRLTASVVVREAQADRPDRQQIIIEGCGAGENGTWLHFTAGSLVMASPNHVMRDFRVSSERADGIIVRPEGEGANYPARGLMQNVRVEYCARSGLTMEDCWVYALINCHLRFNRYAGFEGRVGARTHISCNALTIVGGEIQGNGSKNVSARGTGGGVITGRCVQFSMTGGAIEGNLGDGVVLSQQLRGFAFNSVYFERNGTHPSNCDLTTSHFENAEREPQNAPNSGWLLNCNFTPQDSGGQAQERAIDLVDVRDLRIVNPQFFAQSGPVYYAKEPIRLQETQSARCTGWVEGGYYSSHGYTQNMLRNETARYGFPRVHRYSPDLRLTAVESTSPVFCVPLPADSATRVDINTLSRRTEDGGANAQLTCSARFGPSGGAWSKRTETVNYKATERAAVVQRRVGRKPDAPAPIYVEVQISVPQEPSTTPIHLMSVEIVSYEGHIR